MKDDAIAAHPPGVSGRRTGTALRRHRLTKLTGTVAKAAEGGSHDRVRLVVTTATLERSYADVLDEPLPPEMLELLERLKS